LPYERFNNEGAVSGDLATLLCIESRTFYGCEDGLIPLNPTELSALHFSQIRYAA
jgi:hypothetical protein